MSGIEIVKIQTIQNHRQAAVTWDGIPNEDARKFWVGWMNNWRYASTLSSEE
ncbi:hypothetical protein [Paenibacillus sp. MZ03-122A]|uniref:hypothetical protein n=1 Tax=Paenibacillus sp. MZ03-122A TaxID=2962033 RepID=UPI0020B777E9|nr:hypothetical protein [Paenibacillus sp. MZ03-122A]MCP3781189.1 hypothetical protein [Paenibacillus sp. MZ03-122A]